MTAGMWFGSLSLDKSAATVTVSEPCLLVMLSKNDIEIATAVTTIAQTVKTSREVDALQLQALAFGPRKIGEGTYGQVISEASCTELLSFSVRSHCAHIL